MDVVWLIADPDEEDGEETELENGNIRVEGYFESRIIVISELEIISWKSIASVTIPRSKERNIQRQEVENNNEE